MYWHSLYENRFSWAERAYDKFLTELDPELAKAFKREKEISIVLFGPTQVGKTTLLLKLMGVSENEFDRVATVLRGKQKKGCSATAMPTYYEISPDDNWYIDDISNTGFSDIDITEALADIRSEVESGNVSHNKLEPIKIFIPQCYFTSTRSDLRTKVLDLPGVMASNNHEREMVERVSEKYVPTADLVLMVAKADDMSFLHPENIALEEVSDWVYTPNRFRLVFTHTFSSASFRQILEHNLNTADQVSTYFLEQLKTHIPNLDLSSDQIYPLEYGASYEGIITEGSEYFEKVDRIMTGLFSRLKNDITASGTKENRIRSALDVHVVAERKKNEFVKAKEEFKEYLIDSLSDLIEKKDLLYERLNDEIELFDNLKPEISYDNYKAAVKATEKIMVIDKSLKIRGSNVEDVRTFISDSERDCKRKINKLIDYLYENGISVNINFPSDNFKDLEKNLDYYFIKEYYPSISDDFESDKSSAYSSEKRMFADSSENILREINSIYETFDLQYKKRIDDTKNLTYFLEGNIKKVLEKIEVGSIAIDELEMEVEKYKVRMAESCKKSLRFKEYLYDEYSSECDGILDSVYLSEGLRKFYFLCYLKLVSNIYSSLTE